MRCHVCGETIGEQQRPDLPPLMDGWAWTTNAEGCLGVVTCSGCTKLMHPLVRCFPSSPDYERQIGLAIAHLKEMRVAPKQKLDEDGKLGPRTEEQIRKIQEMFNRPYSTHVEKLVEWAKQMMPKNQYYGSWTEVCDAAFGVVGKADAKAAGAAKEDACPPVPPSLLVTYTAHESGDPPVIKQVPMSSATPCAKCGEPSITRFSVDSQVPLCGICAKVADDANLPEVEKEEIVRKVAEGDRYAWQRLVETQPVYAKWERSDAWRTVARVVSDQPKESEQDRRRRRLREHPGEHIVKVLGMADLFGPKVR